MIRCVIVLLFLVAQLAAEPAVPYKAVVIVPVADAVWRPFYRYGARNIPRQYERLPFSPEKPGLSCCRIHQVKKNEIVIILSIVGDEAECKTDSFYYCECSGGKRKNTFWMLKKYLVPLEDLSKKGIHLPPVIDMHRISAEYNRAVLTLLAPWDDSITKQLYSVGTRFLRCRKRDTAKSFAVYVVTDDLQEKISFVPKEAAQIIYPQKHPASRDQFLKLMRSWASADNSDSQLSIIPYVFGGCSFRGRTPAKGFYQVKGLQCGKSSIFWQRTGSYEPPLDGFDCSSMILCAAHIVGMPYYCKNTYALLSCLKELKVGEELEAGDLVWYQGHVLVVSDLKQDLLIEAVGYDKGYGEVHEIMIDRVFKGIKSFAELIKVSHEGTSVRRLTKKGRALLPPLQIKLLKLRSIWE